MNPSTPAQLSLPLPATPPVSASLPLQFRIDQRTRQRGLAHIAAIKAQLAARAAERDDAGAKPARGVCRAA
jgi:hypothetical protein